MTEDPRPAELSRRIDDIANRVDTGFRDVNMRLSEMPTEKTILAYLAARDIEMQGLRDDVNLIRTEVKESRRRADEAKRFAWTIAVSSGMLFLGIVGVLVQTVGAT